jgi:hypothetical protein
VTEVGRQPWTVYGLLRTADSVSPSLTGYPSGDDGNEADWNYELTQLEKEQRIIEPAAPTEPAAK